MMSRRESDEREKERDELREEREKERDELREEREKMRNLRRN